MELGEKYLFYAAYKLKRKQTNLHCDARLPRDTGGSNLFIRSILLYEKKDQANLKIPCKPTDMSQNHKILIN